MGNCLVTKLKGSVQNDNLPKYDTIILDYNGNKYGSSNVFMYIGSDIPGYVRINSKTQMLIGQTQYTEYTVMSRFTYIEFPDLQQGTPIQEVIKITGVYHLTHMSLGRPLAFNKNSEQKTGLSSILNSNVIVGMSWRGEDPDKLPSGLRLLIINKSENYNDENINKLPSNSIEFISSQAVSGNLQRVDINAIKDNDQLRNIQVRLFGDIAYLPIRSKIIGTGTVLLTGAIEDLVSNMRSKGRVSGAIGFTGNYKWYFTYNNIRVGTQMDEGIIPIYYPTATSTPYIFLTWNQNSINWVDYIPEELTDYVGNWTYYNYYQKFPTPPQD